MLGLPSTLSTRRVAVTLSTRRVTSLPGAATGRLVFRLRRRVPADRDRRRHRRGRELVEAPGGRALLPQAESGGHEGGLDRADGRKLEYLESKIVGRACAGQKLAEHAMLGLDSAELGGVARERPF